VLFVGKAQEKVSVFRTKRRHMKWTPFFVPRVKVEAGACSFNQGAKSQ
jgi:hypothetical protein